MQSWQAGGDRLGCRDEKEQDAGTTKIPGKNSLNLKKGAPKSERISGIIPIDLFIGLADSLYIEQLVA